MLQVPSHALPEVNVFNFRQYEWNESKIIEIIGRMLECIPEYNMRVTHIDICEKENKNPNEIRKTVSKVLKIGIVYHSPEKDEDFPIELDYDIPWLENNHFLIGGNYKACVYQLYDKPTIVTKNIIKIRTNIASFMITHKDTARRVYNYEASIFGKKFPFAKLVVALYGVEGCKTKFYLNDEFEAIPGSDFEELNDDMHELRSDVMKILKDDGINKQAVLRSDFAKMSDAQIIDNIKLTTKIDIFSRRYMNTDNVIDEFIYVLQNGSYDDDDYQNKRLRFIEQVVYCYLCKDFYNILTSIKKNRKFRFTNNSKVILSNANVSSIIQYDTSLNPLSELAFLSRTSLSGPGGFQKANVPLHLREIHPSMLHLLDPSDTGDRDGCGTTQYVVPSASFDEFGALSTTNGDNDPVNSVSTAQVPFCEHDDTVRLQMSSSQQRHAVMLEKFDLPLVQSGTEGMYTQYTSFLKWAEEDGTVIYKDQDLLIVKYVTGEFKTFHVGYRKLYISVLDFYHVYVNVGDSFKKGDILAESNYLNNGKITLGRNLRTCITPWYGYNYEDAIVISESVRKNKVFASVHYGQVVVEVPESKVLLNLNDDIENYQAIPKIGDRVKTGQTIAKVKAVDTEKFTDVVFEPISEVHSDEDGEIIDIKIYANSWNKCFEQYNKFIKDAVNNQKEYRKQLEAGLHEYLSDEQVESVLNTLDVNKSEKNNYKIKGDSVDGVRIEITYKYERNLQLGDKLANRHGNKGTISRFVPDELMPVTEDGTRADIVINPLGIVSRMNIGQVYECHLSQAVLNLRKMALEMIENKKSNDEIKSFIYGFVDIIDKTPGKNYSVQLKEIFDPINDTETLKKAIDNFYVIQPPFQSIGPAELDQAMEYTNSKYEVPVYDPVSKKMIQNELVFGSLYFMKLNHISQDKLAARGIGPYSAKTSQPLGGKTRKGGQRLGEMEVWAVIAHGDEINLHEFTTVKSDSISLRNKYIANCMSNDEMLDDIDDDEVPQSLRLLQTNLASLGLNFQIQEGENTISEEIDDEPLDSIEGLEESPFELDGDIFETED